MKKISTLMGVGAALAAGAVGHAAVVSIDDFSLAQTAIQIGPNDGKSAVSGAGPIGGSREVTISNTDPTDEEFETIFGVSNVSGTARFDSGAGILSTFVVDWDGLADGSFDSMGLGGISLLGASGSNNRISFGANFVDGISAVSFTIWDVIGNSATSSAINVSSAGVFSVAFAQFAGVDLGAVGAIRMTVENMTEAADLRLDFVQADPIPVPGAVVLFGTALVGFGAAMRRR